MNSSDAIAIRQKKLGYTKENLADLELFHSLHQALEAAAEEGHRGKPVALSGKQDITINSKKVDLDFPIIQYPKAFTLLTPYPLHTYLVFSVERSLSGEGRVADERFQTFTDFMAQELRTVKENDQIGQLANSIRQSFLTRKKQRLAFKKIATISNDKKNTKICLLWKELSNPTGSSKKMVDTLADRSVYNEMFHITGEIWSESFEVIKYPSRPKNALSMRISSPAVAALVRKVIKVSIRFKEPPPLPF